MPPTVAVVGAGLSGLTAAYRLVEAGWAVEVFESEPEVGGRTRSLRRQGYLVDTGASALAASYHGYLGLTEELGIRDQVVRSAPCIGIVRNGRVRLIHLDRMLRSGMTTDLLSWPAKFRVLRLGIDTLLARCRGQLDYGDMRRAAPLDTETARSYALRALGADLDAYLCEPIVRTMLIADADKVSKVELFSGIANIFTTQIHAMLGGQGRVALALADRVPVTVNAPVEQVRVSERRVAVDVRRDGRVETRHYDACVVSTPLPVTEAICPDRRALLTPLANALTYTSAITVAIGTARRPDCPAMLIQLPSREDPDIALIFLDHNKAPDRAPADRGLLTCCWETGAATSWLGAPDEDIVEHTVAALRRVFPDLALAEIDFSHVTRWRSALPLTGVGAYRAIGEFNAALNPADRIQFAADYLSAAGQNTAVEFGNRAAANLIAHLIAHR